MFRKMSNLLISLCLSASPTLGMAATHDVTVGNNFFSPNDLTIEVGDTVRWTNNAGRTHDVTADDFSWASATASSFVYERTFTSVEEILYHCSVHSSPGRDIKSFQNGRIDVVDSTQAGFRINAGLSDAWYNPATDGQGFFIIVWEDIQYIFLSWFTYETERPPEDVEAIIGEPGHRWLTAEAPYEEGDKVTLDVYLSRGMEFDKAEPAVENPRPVVGSIEITWTGCNAATAVYDLPDLGLAGEIPIQRIVPDNIPACEAAQAESE
jgi:plastocyanin